MKRIDSKGRYKNFVNKRDASLERFLLKTRAKVADELRRFIAVVQVEINRTYPLLNKNTIDPNTRMALRFLDEAIAKHAEVISQDIAHHWIVMRYMVYPLAQAGEQQALIQTKGGKPKVISLEDMRAVAYGELHFGGSIEGSVQLSMSRLRRDIMDAVEVSRLMQDELPACMERVLKIFPKEERLKRPKALSRVREADIKRGQDVFSLGDFFLSEDEWQDIVDEYKADFIPRWRDPRYGQLASPVSLGDKNEVAVYPWELERNITEDFVDTVRKGEHDAAKKQGITDFVWIAVVDNRTDDCCLKRDGLTTTEIKTKLDGEWAEDKCRAFTPAAHPNCRCRLAPATDNLPDIPDAGEAEFNDWLDSRKNK